MNITDVRVYINAKDSKILANASITFNDKLVITGIKVLYGTNGLFASMPSYKNKDGEWKSFVFSLDKQLREEMNDKIVTKYNQMKTTEHINTRPLDHDIRPPVKDERQKNYDNGIDVTKDDLPF